MTASSAVVSSLNLSSGDTILRDLVFHLMQLDFWTLCTITDARANEDLDFYGPRDYDEFTTLCSEQFDPHLKYYQSHGAQYQNLRLFFNCLDNEQIVKRIQDASTTFYVSRMFEQRVRVYEIWDGRACKIEYSGDVIMLPKLLSELPELNWSELLTYCRDKARTNHIHLRSVHQIATRFGDSCDETALKYLLGKTSMERLKCKVTAFEVGFLELRHRLERFESIYGQKMRKTIRSAGQ